tara:strand:+ start:4506 stop:4841 length:336 start_codon:yes stop_codon:yes gene_type:complete
MRLYKHPLQGKHRFMGFKTNDTDISIAVASVDELYDEDYHYHKESDEIYITAEGQGTLEIENKLYLLEPGKVIRVEKGEKHRVVSVDMSPFTVYALKVPDIVDDKVIINKK